MFAALWFRVRELLARREVSERLQHIEEGIREAGVCRYTSGPCMVCDACVTRERVRHLLEDVMEDAR